MGKKKKNKKNIDRRDFISGTVGAGLAVGMSGVFSEIAKAAKGSNILFISIDDLNDWGGPFGNAHQNVHTPGLDKLASMGTTFTRAYCAAPACGPSRNALMTGVHPLTWPVDSNVYTYVMQCSYFSQY